MNQTDINLITRRYVEAQANPTITQWRSLAYMAALKADTIQEADPQSEEGEIIRAIADKAWANYMELMPKRDEGYLNSLAGVVVGWFKGVTA